MASAVTARLSLQFGANTLFYFKSAGGADTCAVAARGPRTCRETQTARARRRLWPLAHELAPGESEPLVTLAADRINRGCFDTALEACQKVLDRQPSHAHALSNREVAFANLGRREDREEIVTRLYVVPCDGDPAGEARARFKREPDYTAGRAVLAGVVRKTLCLLEKRLRDDPLALSDDCDRGAGRGHEFSPRLGRLHEARAERAGDRRLRPRAKNFVPVGPRALRMLSKRKGMGQPLDEQEWPRAGKQERGALHEKRGAPKIFQRGAEF